MNSFEILPGGKNNGENKEKDLNTKQKIEEILQGRSIDDIISENSKVVSLEYKKIENILGFSLAEIPNEMREKMLEAKEVMEDSFFSYREIEEAFGIKINRELIPEIPFSQDDLERARELKQMLILRVDKKSEREPLTIAKMSELLKGKVKDGGKTLLYDNGSGKIEDSDSAWYKKEDFITKETPKLAWALVGKEVIPGSLGKNYLEQTEEIVEYLKNKVFEGKKIPSEFQAAIGEFEKSKDEIENLLAVDWRKAAEKLVNLQITKITRPTPVEVFYDLILYFQNRGERLLEDIPRFTWTSSRNSNEEFIRAGFFTRSGVSFSPWGPDGADSYLGATFSRLK